MNFFTTFSPILFFITLTGFSQSASLNNAQEQLTLMDSEGLEKYIEKYNFNDHNIVSGDIMEKNAAKSTRTMLNNAIIDNKKLWNPKKPIPVIVQHSFPNKMKDAIETALNEIQDNTCLRFKNAQNGDNKTGVLVYTDGPGCSSYLGYQGGIQQISMNTEGCACPGAAIHETMHALGFDHEHSRSDRDDYITIVTDNIKQGDFGNFEKLREDQNRLLTEYDYDSIMHYTGDAFRKSPGLKTMQPKKEGVELLHACDKGTLSTLDIVKINKLYDCTSYLDGTDNLREDVEPFVLRRE